MNTSRVPAHDDGDKDDDDDDDGGDDELEHDGPSADGTSRGRRTQRAQDAPGSGRLARRTNRAQDAEPKSRGYDASQRPRRTQRAQDAQAVPHPHSDDVAQDSSS